MARVGRLAVYVTSHGFGHLNRVVAVLNQMPEGVPLTIRCHPNLFDHWRERLRRSADLEPHASDAGAVNPPGNSAETDGLATLEQAAIVQEQARAELDAETDRLADGETAAVLCDAPPMPLVAARRAGVPSYLLANFTWAEIYAPHARKHGGPYPALVRELQEAYAQATLAFRLQPGLKLAGVAETKDVGLVVSPGSNRRDELRHLLGLTRTERLVYSYLGRYGQDSIDWERMARWESEGVHFVGFHPAPSGATAPPNLHVVHPQQWTGADLAASTDVVVAKAGYGTVCEAMAARTPMIYPPRTGFAEHGALVRAMTIWGGGFQAPRRAFDRLRIDALLKSALNTRPGPPPFPTDGAARVAEHLTRVCRGLDADARAAS